MHNGGALIYSYGGIKVSDKELKINTEKLRQWKKGSIHYSKCSYL